jgi:hypothetical protein
MASVAPGQHQAAEGGRDRAREGQHSVHQLSRYERLYIRVSYVVLIMTSSRNVSLDPACAHSAPYDTFLTWTLQRPGRRNFETT